MRLVICSADLSDDAFIEYFRMQRRGSNNAAGDPELAKKIRRFSPTILTADTARLSAGDRKALKKIIEAAKLLDPLFLRQVWSGNDALQAEVGSRQERGGPATSSLFSDQQWSMVAPRQQRTLYRWRAARKTAVSRISTPTTLLKRNSIPGSQPCLPLRNKKQPAISTQSDATRIGKLMTVPYSEEYREFLEPAAKLLREAAALTTNQTLKDFLSKRADAFASNDYYASDVAWMDLNSPIRRDHWSLRNLRRRTLWLQSCRSKLTSRCATPRRPPSSRSLASTCRSWKITCRIEARYRNPKLGAASPMRVVNEVFGSGEGN